LFPDPMWTLRNTEKYLVPVRIQTPTVQPVARRHFRATLVPKGKLNRYLQGSERRRIFMYKISMQRESVHNISVRDFSYMSVGDATGESSTCDVHLHPPIKHKGVDVSDTCKLDSGTRP
jgi:hypothetical protein